MGIENATIQPGPDGKAHIILEKGQVKLNDLSQQTFDTDDLQAFGAFAAAQKPASAIFYNHTKLVQMPVEGVTSKTKPLATCSLSLSEPLALFKQHLGKSMDLAAFEKLLTALRRNGQFLGVISQLRTLVISKETKFQREVDNSANFKLLIERKGAAGDWTPPATLTFSLPVFAFIPDAITVEADLIMTMKDEDGGAPTFTLEVLTFSEDLKNRQREILEFRLGDWTTIPKYWGSHSITEVTDAYLYKDIGAQL